MESEEREPGCDEATIPGVVQELIDSHGLSYNKASCLVRKHGGILQDGIRTRSFCYYVANQMLKAEQA